MKGKKLAALVLSACLMATSAATVMAQDGGQWKQNSVGWWYEDANGGYPAAQWRAIDSKWYYFDNRGYMTTGWQKVDGEWYYLNADGSMAFGWKQVNGNWYYLNQSGVLVTGWKEINGGQYCFDENGAMRTGWIKRDGKWSYLHPDTGWLLIEGMTKDGYTIQGGYWAEDVPWQFVGGVSEVPEDLFHGADWYDGYFYDENRKLCDGWRKQGNDWYYYQDGKLGATVGWEQIDGKWYYMSQGKMTTGFVSDQPNGKDTYLIDQNGNLFTGWIKGNKTLDHRMNENTWYHFDETTGKLDQQSTSRPAGV